MSLARQRKRFRGWWNLSLSLPRPGIASAYLQSCGYSIVYDGELRRLATPPSVPELVARMATCNFFMPILTEPYRRRVELAANDVAVKEDGWVFDEWQLALKLYVIERIRIAAVWRAGPVVPVPLKGPRSR